MTFGFMNAIRGPLHFTKKIFKDKNSFNLRFDADDMVLSSSEGLIATNCETKCLIHISGTGRTRTICYTAPLNPWSLCINNRQQIVVGVGADSGKRPIKLLVYNANGSLILQTIEMSQSNIPLFRKNIMQVMQNNNGDYVVCDHNRIVCVGREGIYKWEHDFGIGVMYSMVCDRYDNIITVDPWCNEVKMISGDGKKITRLLLTKRDGISDPWSLSIDKYGALWIGQKETIIIAKYLK